MIEIGCESCPPPAASPAAATGTGRLEASRPALLLLLLLLLLLRRTVESWQRRSGWYGGAATRNQGRERSRRRRRRGGGERPSTVYRSTVYSQPGGRERERAVQTNNIFRLNSQGSLQATKRLHGNRFAIGCAPDISSRFPNRLSATRWRNRHGHGHGRVPFGLRKAPTNKAVDNLPVSYSLMFTRRTGPLGAIQGSRC